MTRDTTERLDFARVSRLSPAGCPRSVAARRQSLWLLVLIFTGFSVTAAEVIPPSPEHYFNDYAHAVSTPVSDRLNVELETFEKATSSQIVVAIFPKMQTDSSIEDYAQRIFEAWKPGQKKLDNGAILFVFVQDHKMRIHTGYGLEGALPDVICKRILDDEIAPRLRAGDFDGGMAAGVHAMIAATRGEYKGTGRTVAERQRSPSAGALPLLFPLIIFIIIISLARRSGTYYSRSGRTRWGFGPMITGGSSWSGGSSGGGGGFSGGGGSSGGGGASGSW